MSLPSQHHRRAGQHGVAIVSAMVLVALASLLVGSLFWREYVSARSVQNRLALAQLRWIESAVLDWAAVVLKSDQSSTGAVDHLLETWATPVAETRLDETVTAGARISERSRAALIAGQIFDAQARLNLNNLVVDGKPSPRHAAAFQRLLALLGLSPELEAALTARLLAAYPPAGADGKVRPFSMPLLRTRELLRVPGYDERAVALLEPFVIFLPRRIPGQDSAGLGAATRVNINTAPAEVIAATAEDMSLEAARRFVLVRERNFHATLDQAASRFDSQRSLSPDLFSVGSSFFLLVGMVRFERVEVSSEALFFRGPSRVELVWRQQS